MFKTIIQRGAIVLAAAAAGGALAVLPSVSVASSNSHACGNANSHTRNVRASNTSCRNARYWAVRNRCPQHWVKSGDGTTTIGGSGGSSGSPDRWTCARGRESFSWTRTSGSGGSGTGTITIG
jgi:hypothetical protein